MFVLPDENSYLRFEIIQGAGRQSGIDGIDKLPSFAYMVNPEVNSISKRTNGLPDKASETVPFPFTSTSPILRLMTPLNNSMLPFTGISLYRLEIRMSVCVGSGIFDMAGSSWNSDFEQAEEYRASSNTSPHRNDRKNRIEVTRQISDLFLFVLAAAGALRFCCAAASRWAVRLS